MTTKPDDWDLMDGVTDRLTETVDEVLEADRQSIYGALLNAPKGVGGAQHCKVTIVADITRQEDGSAAVVAESKWETKYAAKGSKYESTFNPPAPIKDGLPSSDDWGKDKGDAPDGGGGGEEETPPEHDEPPVCEDPPEEDRVLLDDDGSILEAPETGGDAPESNETAASAV